MSTPPTTAQPAAASGRRYAVIRYTDGREDHVAAGRPIHVYQAIKLVGADASDVELGFVTTWLAAGKPDGSVEAWLETVDDVDFEDAAVPPPSASTP